MGYYTDFDGEFEITPTLSQEHKSYLKAFSHTRRMKRSEALALTLSDPLRDKVGLPIGIEGSYFVGGKGYGGQDKDESITNYNKPPTSQPSLWCPWIPNLYGDKIKWDEGEKAKCYVQWIQYLIDNFLQPWGYSLSGEVHWQGEYPDDEGFITITDNQVTVKRLEKKIFKEFIY